jgi:four helix bundle protein
MRVILDGLHPAVHVRMATARSYEELEVWQLTARLRDEVLNRCVSWRHRDVDLHDQLRDAVRSAPRNLAEGFGHFNPREFARYVRIARASLFEARNHLQDARTRRYLSAEEFAPLLELTRRAVGATTRLVHLDSCHGKPPTGWNP